MTQEFSNRPHATEKDYERAFEGLDFPVSIHRILQRAADVGGIDREVSAILHRLPREQYASLAELKGDVRAIYASDGVPEEALPF